MSLKSKAVTASGKWTFSKSLVVVWEWCKIDLEVDAAINQVPPFPIELANIITAQEGNRTEEEENKIKSLYDLNSSPRTFLHTIDV